MRKYGHLTFGQLNFVSTLYLRNGGLYAEVSLTECAFRNQYHTCHRMVRVYYTCARSSKLLGKQISAGGRSNGIRLDV